MAARLVVDGFEGQLHVDAPASGVQNLRWDEQAQAGYLFGVNFNMAGHAAQYAVEEAYVRGRDLIATYRQTELQPFRPQVYWRASHARPLPRTLASLDFIASVETSLLDIRPEMVVTTSLLAEDVWQVSRDSAVGRAFSRSPSEDVSAATASGWILYRLAGGRRSCALMVHPQDRHRSSLLRDSLGFVRLSCRLFAENLEKGVILRARLRCVLVDQATDLASGADCFEAFLRSPLPLTT